MSLHVSATTGRHQKQSYRDKGTTSQIVAKGFLGRTIAQAVSRLLPTEAALVLSRVRSCGICGGQSGNGSVFFLQVLRFPLPILIPPTAQHLSTVIRAWYDRPPTYQVCSASPHPKTLKLNRRGGVLRL
jgi:hypothetical protein